MKHLFELDSPFFQFITKLGNLLILNFLFLICSLPIVTIGAAAAALYKACQEMAANTEFNVISSFFRAFRENFAQGTLAWLMEAFFLGGMLCWLFLVFSVLSGGAAFAAECAICVLTALVLGICAYLFPLIARYRNTLWEHLKNALLLAVLQLPRTILLVLLNTLPFWILQASEDAFMKSLFFWAFLGFAFVAYLNSILLLPVFRKLEKQEARGDCQA